MQFLELLLVITFGLCMGSFITMASHRFSLEGEKIKDLLLKRSHCVMCKKQLKIKNLVPLFSWVIQKGKCSFCRGKIAIKYPLIEFSTAIIFVIIYFSVGKIIDAKLALICLIATLMIIAVITDLEGYFIPDTIQITLAVLILVFHLFNMDEKSLFYYFSSAILFFIFGLILHLGFLFVTKKDGIGFGDIKFFAVAGFLLGYSEFAVFMLFSGALGIIFGLIWKKITKAEIFPFAPSLIASLAICLLLGDRVNFLYLPRFF